MSGASAVQSCTICDTINATFCSQCRCISYCSKSCQKRDWSTHKLLCGSFPTFPTSKRPYEHHYRAVLFDPHKEKSEFIWLLCEWSRDDYNCFQMPKTDTIIGTDTIAKHIPIQYNPKLEKILSNTLLITYRDTFLVDGSAPSKSVASITATQPGECHDWRGPIIAYARKGPGLDPPTSKDFDMVDFRHITDYFLSYAYTPSKTHPAEQMVKGVRINCLGDMVMFKRPRFEEIELPATHAIFTKHDTSDIADRIGLPILTQRCPPDPKWANSSDPMFKGSSPYNNQDATFLHQCCDPAAESNVSTGSLGWGWCSAPWQNKVGSAIVVRKDGKPLLPIHLEALSGYCRTQVEPLMGHSHVEFDPEEPMKKEHVRSIICRPMFVIYWYKFVEEKKEYTTPSPYDN